MARIKYVDGFRGFALLSMVFMHVYDALAKTSIYTDAPFFIKAINTPLFNPPALFTIVSGMSVYLAVTHLLKNNTKSETAKKTAITYIKYIMLSLPFTIFMWGLPTYLEWNEAIQGIGLSALITALIIIYLKPRNYELILSIILLTLARGYILESQPLSNIFPYNTDLTNPLITLGSTVLNALYRGWFSVMNLVPLMLSGIIFYKATRKHSVKKLLILSALLTIISIYLHFNGLSIDYYSKSINFTLYAIGSCGIIFSIIKWVYDKREISFLTKAGMHSLGIYISHHLLILKPIWIYWRDTLPEINAFLIAIPLTWLAYMIVKHVKITIKPNATILKEKNIPQAS